MFITHWNAITYVHVHIEYNTPYHISLPMSMLHFLIGLQRELVALEQLTSEGHSWAVGVQIRQGKSPVTVVALGLVCV